MKILHTSDIHLSQFEDERWSTLIKLLEIGKKEEIDLFAISGDLFDKDIYAEDLRPQIRNIFSKNKFKIVILPGNHDKESYKAGLFYGEDAIVINDLSQPFEYKDVRIWGFPFNLYDEKMVINKLQTIRDELKPDKINIMLYHGELLDSFFSRYDFGDEGEDRYMPVKLLYFKDLNIDYVLAGHFHSKFEVWQIDNKKYFTYCGSPISITKKETGPRKINLFNLGSPPTEFILDTPYYENLNIKLDPIAEFNPIEKIKLCFKGVNPKAKICLMVNGYINNKRIGLSEEELVHKIKEVIPINCEEQCYDFKDISSIIEDDLFSKFMRKLDEKGYANEKKERMRELAIKAMMGMK